AARRREGRRRVRAHLLGRRHRGDRPPVHPRDRPVGAGGDPPVLLRGHAREGPVLRRPPALPRARGQPARPPHLRLPRLPCVSTAYAGWRATVGAVMGNDAEQMVDAELVILWGINAAYTHINVMTLVKQARARGAHVICIDPYRTRTARQADQHLAIRSGTD